jgi:hypothetical protein
MTRSIITAVVTFDIFRKSENGIETETLEQKIVKCDSKEKAEMILSKDHKNALIDIKSIQFIKTVRKITEEDFIQHSMIVSEEIVEM